MSSPYASKIQPQTKPMPVPEQPPAMRQRYSEDPAIAAAIAEMNAYTGLGKKAKRF
jgi:hypothetical protein